MKHFVTIDDASDAELRHIFEVAAALRHQRQLGRPNQPLLAHKTLAMVFEKPSLRTRLSFAQAAFELGGNVISFSGDEVGLGKRELGADVARVISGMVQGICARVFEHEKLTELAAHSAVPVINALSDYSHPCQALADVMTMYDEFGSGLAGRTIAFIGDGNNVARSLASLSGRLGIHFVLAAPKGFELEQSFINHLHQRSPGMKFHTTQDPIEAVRHADVIYTDTWVSMGQEAEKEHRKQVFGKYQVNGELLAHAPKHTIVLHCLPAYRGLEITHDVMEGPHSRVFPQAHNRLHAQKGLLAVLLGGA